MNRILNRNVHGGLVFKVLRRVARVATGLRGLLPHYKFKAYANTYKYYRERINCISATKSQYNRDTRRSGRDEFTQTIHTRRYCNLTTHSDRQRIISNHVLNQKVSVYRVQGPSSKIYNIII